MPTVTFELPEELARRLAEAAERMHVDSRDLVLKALTFYLLVRMDPSQPPQWVKR